ncbi:lipase family protein [Novosphingobium sp. 1949]|uniref:Lipase family protein n=1 Tax=Novosphingobium organovorum TaxID=2930092 RepID=A0ABT0BF65_9SPHN|nr:lipase family protein [Novosphingobium organovorum]MCJ2183498.1 lipase family protein [Novosphingobium organovorum]
MHPLVKSLGLLLTAPSLAVFANPTLAQTSVSTDAQADRWSGDGGVDAFYTWDQAIPARAGVMLRTQDAPQPVSLPSAARSVRILYSSTEWNDPQRTRTVSGIVFFPKGPVPKGGFPVIAWAHGTTGIADPCAPSAQPRSARDTQYLDYWLEHGYAIVASDYAGLGTPGVHPYLNYRSEGYSVLDAIRAALARFPELDAKKVVSVGQSQGSEAAIAAAYLAPRYAPDVTIRATVATGIVAHTANVGKAPQAPLGDTYVDAADYGNSAFEILWFLGTARPLGPAESAPLDYLSSGGWAMLADAQKECLTGLRVFARQQKLPFSQFYKREIAELDRRTQAGTDFPDVHITTPVFTGTGLVDTEAAPAKQYNFVSAMCAAGTTVEAHYYPGQSHNSTVPASLADAPAFVAAVLAGKTITGNCASLKPPVKAG